MSKEKLPRTLIKLELNNTKTPPTYRLLGDFNLQKEQGLHEWSTFVSIFITI